MRVALYENLPSGGAKREAFELARKLVDDGHVVDLWTTTAADVGLLNLESVTRRVVRYAWPWRVSLPSPISRLGRYAKAAAKPDQLRRVIATSRRMAHDIDAEGYDFVFAHSCKPIQGPFLLRYLRTPSVYFCHETLRAIHEPRIQRPYDSAPGGVLQRVRSGTRSLAMRVADTVKEREDFINVQRAKVLLTNSQFSAESIYRVYRRWALVSYLGVDEQLFRPLGLPRQDFVLSVGEIGAHKGYDFLIEALARMSSASRPKLVIVGNNRSELELAYLRSLAFDRGVAVDFRCGVTDSELVRLYNEARVFVYAPVLEPFGLAPLEAMACATPVVAVAEGGVRESVTDGITGLLTQRDPEMFANALRGLLEHEDWRRRLGSAGVRSVQAFWTWSAAFARFMEMVRSGLGEQARESHPTASRGVSP